MPSTSPFRWFKDARVVGAGSLATAGLAGSLISLVALPFITRTYPPATYAQFAVFASVVLVASTAASGRYEMATIVAKHDPDGDREAWKSARLAIRVSLAVFALLQASAVLAVLIGVPSGADQTIAFLAAPLAVLVSAVGTVQASVLTRLGRYHTLAILGVARTVITLSVQLAMGMASSSMVSLILGYLVGTVFPLVVLPKLLYTLPRDCLKTYGELAREHQSYPKFQVFAALANSLSNNVFIFALAVAFDDYTVGLFAIAMRLVLLPAGLTTGPINSVFFREAAKMAGQPRLLESIYLKLSMGLFAVGVLAFSILALVVDPLVTLLGPEWGGTSAVILASIPMGLASFIGALPNSVLITFGRQGRLLAWRLGITLLPPGMILLAPSLGIGAVSAILISSSILLFLSGCYAVYGFWTIRNSLESTSSPPPDDEGRQPAEDFGLS